MPLLIGLYVVGERMGWNNLVKVILVAIGLFILISLLFLLPPNMITHHLLNIVFFLGLMGVFIGIPIFIVWLIMK